MNKKERIYLASGTAEVTPPENARYFAGGFDWNNEIYFYDENKNFIVGYSVRCNGADVELVRLTEPDPSIYWENGFPLLPAGRMFPPIGGKL